MPTAKLPFPPTSLHHTEIPHIVFGALQCYSFPQKSSLHGATSNRMQWLHADGSTCDDSHCLVIPTFLIPILQVRFDVKNRFPTTLCTRSLLPSTHNSPCTPLTHLLGACRVDCGCDRFRMQIACRNRMPRDRDHNIAHL